MIDHINRQPLDNRAENLRFLSAQGSTQNRGFFKNNTSGFKGVWYETNISKWRAGITVGYKKIKLGSFATPEAAAEAYDQAAKEHFGELAVLNFPEETKT